MRFYRATRFLFPRSFELRLLSICFLAVHVPLIACIVFSALTGKWPFDTLLVVLLATLAGTAAGVAAIHALLAPLKEATAMLGSIQQGERVDSIPVGGEDLVGRLLRGVSRAANESADRSERLTDAAERDLLTGVLNRRGFFTAAGRVMTPEQPSVIALIDLDHFKAINDNLGHAVGDAMLHAFAERLCVAVRRSDICARWGGEEFAVLLPGASLAQSREVMERLRTSLASQPLSPEVQLTFSCGLASIVSASALDEAAHRADQALYAAKNQGRDQIASAD
jgi:diguanylate cyclase (GGDEF)-like protein